MTSLRAVLSIALDRVADWIMGPADDGIPEECRRCGDQLPDDPWEWERWEFEHEHLERAW